MAEPLAAGDLRQLLGALDRIGDELGAIGTWLAKLDHDQPSMLLQGRLAQRGHRRLGAGAPTPRGATRGARLGPRPAAQQAC